MDGSSCVAERVVGNRSYNVFSGEDGNIGEREDRHGRVRVSTRVRRVYLTVMFEGGVNVDSALEDRKKDAVAVGERWLKKGW